MRIGQFTEYRGYIGSIEYDPEDKIHYGQLLNIDDSVNYHGKTGEELYKHYCKAVDDYIEFKEKLHEIEDAESNKVPDIYIGDRQEDMATLDVEFINKFNKIWSDYYT